MKIFIKLISGHTISLDNVEPETSIGAILFRSWLNRCESQKDIALKDYAKAVNLIYAGRTLDNQCTLSIYGIKEGSTLHVLAKSWTMAPNFDWTTMTIPDHISGIPIQEPYMLNSGCAHVFEKATLKSLAEKPAQLEKVCPSCQSKIDPSHLVYLSITKSFSHQNSKVDTLDIQQENKSKLAN